MDNEPTRRSNLRRGVFILPNLMTTASLFAGFMGIVWASRGLYEHAAVAVLLSAVFDGLDGKIARWTNTASDFGVQYDSLADLVAFGASPAFLLYHWQLHTFGRLGIAACFLFMTFGALRLARFNIQSGVVSKKFFVGLPIPAAGCTVATLTLFAPHLNDMGLMARLPSFCLILAFVLSLLMVSRIRYVSFKEYGLLRAHPFSAMVTAILLFVLLASQPRLLAFLFLIGYVLSGPIYTYLVLPRRHPGLLREQQKPL